MKLARVFRLFVLIIFLSNSVTTAYAVSVYSLSSVSKSTTSSKPTPLPVFVSKSDKISPIAARDQAWAIADLYPAELYELDVLVDSLDYEMEQAFKFVRDSIQFDPYRGVLRGSHGALGAQAGNSIDRSLLLKEMLDTMGFETRLVYGRLSTDEAKRLLKSSVGTVDTESGGSATDAEKLLAAAAMTVYNWLVNAFGDDSIGAQLTSASVADVTEHVWVQAKDGSEWIDMDTSFPKAELGAAYTEPERYGNEPANEDYHSIKVSVVAETLNAGKLKEDIILEYEINVPEAERSKIFMYFAPHGAGQGRTLAKALGPDAKFLPVIQVGEKRTSGKPIPGMIPTPEQMTKAKKFFYGTDNAVTTALHLDIQSNSPDGSSAREKRVLFDRVPSKVRAGGMPEVEKLIELRTHNGTPVAYQQIHQILVSNGGVNPRRAWTDVGYGAWLPERLKEMGEDEMTMEQALWQLGMMQSIYPLISEGITIPALNDLPDARFFVGEPRVFILSLGVLKKEDETLVEQSIDLLFDDIQQISVGASGKQLAQRKRWYGVLQSALETSSVASMAMAAGYSAETVLSAFNSVGSKAEVLTTAKDLDDSVNYPARLLSDLQSGKIVVHAAETREAVDTWWTIAPGDGSTKAMLAPGLGGSSYGYHTGRGYSSVGGGARRGGFYRVYPKNMTSTPLNPDGSPKSRPKPTKPPPQSCKAGGTEYTTVQCGVSLATITIQTLVIASVGLALLIGLMLVNLYLRENIRDKYGQGEY